MEAKNRAIFRTDEGGIRRGVLNGSTGCNTLFPTLAKVFAVVPLGAESSPQMEKAQPLRAQSVGLTSGAKNAFQTMPNFCARGRRRRQWRDKGSGGARSREAVQQTKARCALPARTRSETPSRNGRARGSFQSRTESLWPKRFRDMIQETHGAAPFHVSFRVEAAHGHAADGTFRTQFFHQVPPGPIGQLQIAQKEIELDRLRQGASRSNIRRNINFVSDFGEKLAERLGGIRMIFDDYHAQMFSAHCESRTAYIMPLRHRPAVAARGAKIEVFGRRKKSRVRVQAMEYRRRIQRNYAALKLRHASAFLNRVPSASCVRHAFGI